MASSVSFSPSTSAETRSLITSSAGWARRSATTPAKYSRSASDAARPRSMSATRPMSSTDQRWNCGKSSSGRPSRRAITRTGNSNVSWRTRSASPSATKRSICSSMIGRMNSGSQRARAFSRKAWATRLRWLRCSGSSMPEDHVAHHHADGHVVAGRGERLGVAQNPRAVVVAVGDPSRLDVDALGQGVGGDGQALVHRRVAALGDEVGVRVPRRPGHHVVEGAERVVLLSIG